MRNRYSPYSRAIRNRRTINTVERLGWGHGSTTIFFLDCGHVAHVPTSSLEGRRPSKYSCLECALLATKKHPKQHEAEKPPVVLVGSVNEFYDVEEGND